jgi:DNA-binding IclR family transcriptional regulator
MNAVAAPVRGAGSEVIAALSISGPSYRVSPGRLPELGRRVAGVADELSARLGFDRRSTHAVQRIRAGAG